MSTHSPLELRTDEPNTTQVFVSWSKPIGERFGRRIAMAIKDTIAGSPTVFFSPFSIRVGDNPTEAILQALDACKVLVPILTRAEEMSHWVTFEAAYVAGRQQTVIPIFTLDPVTSFPGPLAAHFQGVSIHERDRLDNALNQIALAVGSTRLRPLTDEEFHLLATPPESSINYMAEPPRRTGILLEESHGGIIEGALIHGQDQGIVARRSNRLTAKDIEID